MIRVLAIWPKTIETGINLTLFLQKKERLLLVCHLLRAICWPFASFYSSGRILRPWPGPNWRLFCVVSSWHSWAAAQHWLLFIQNGTQKLDPFSSEVSFKLGAIWWNKQSIKKNRLGIKDIEFETDEINGELGLVRKTLNWPLNFVFCKL